MPDALELDDRANGSRVALASGQYLFVRLSENPSTGYRWAVESSGALQLESNDFSGAMSGGVGAGGTRTLKWRAVAGTHQITLVLQRPWEPLNAATSRFSLTVVSS